MAVSELNGIIKICVTQGQCVIFFKQVLLFHFILNLFISFYRELEQGRGAERALTICWPYFLSLQEAGGRGSGALPVAVTPKSCESE